MVLPGSSCSMLFSEGIHFIGLPGPVLDKLPLHLLFSGIVGH